MVDSMNSTSQDNGNVQPIKRNLPVAEPGLSISNLQVSYGQIQVLWGINFSIPKGEMLTILGPNGAGKTTLMKSISGLIPAQAGQIQLHGETINKVPAHNRVRMGLSLVPEGRGMLQRLTVMENLLLGTYSRKASERQATFQEDIEQVLTLFPRLRGKEKQASGSLSGGEMQMLAIGRALMAKPKVLMLDEPTLGLAPLIAQQVIESLGELRHLGLTIIVVEQKSPGLPAMSDQVLIMRQGRFERNVGRDVGADELLAAYFGGVG
ncbi:MAG: ABC transporter ATP-binding protein [Anaerolineales bacterium]|nr:ABC transporter ATP-binding protein [Anaerolineales bacterium]